jgi:phage terminase large subunit-like protein
VDWIRFLVCCIDRWSVLIEPGTLRISYVSMRLFTRSLSGSLLVPGFQVEKQGAHFFGITISEAQAGVVIRVVSPVQSKFKVCSLQSSLNF